MKIYLEDPLGWDALLFNGLAEKVGMEVDQVRFLCTVFGSFPLVIIHRCLPHGSVRHLFSIFWGVIFSLAVCREDSIHPFVTSLVSYIMMRTLPNDVMPHFVLGWTFLYLSASHIYAYWYEYLVWHMDYTSVQMILTVKLQLLAFNIADGCRKVKTFHPKSDNERDAVPKEDVPSIFEFYSFVLFYPCYMPGPCFTWKSYKAWISGDKPTPAGSYLAAFWKFLGALVIIALNKVVAPLFPADAIYNGGLDSFHPVQRLIYIWLCILLARTKYFVVWYLAHSACILSGFGYTGKAEKGAKSSLYNSMFDRSVDSEGNDWSGCSNGNYFAVELSQNVKGVTDNWNMGVGHWLKNVVYFRLTSVLGERSQLPVLLTQLYSAFWHGFYPGYYLFFTSASLLTIVARNSRTKLRPYFIAAGSTAKMFYDLIGILCTTVSVNYVGLPFIVLDWDYTLTVCVINFIEINL